MKTGQTMEGANSDCRHFVAGFWPSSESDIRIHLRLLGADDAEGKAIAKKVCKRFSKVEPVVPRNAGDAYWVSYAALICDAVSAEQRLFAASKGHLPGKLIGDWPPTPIAFDDPFLRAMQVVVSEIEAEANAATGARGLN